MKIDAVYLPADVNECVTMPEPCANGGTCVNRNEGYNCTCTPQFTGDRCTKGQSIAVAIIAHSTNMLFARVKNHVGEALDWV